jgi:hypothetical protein
LSDCVDYFITQCFPAEYKEYQAGGSSIYKAGKSLSKNSY